MFFIPNDSQIKESLRFFSLKTSILSRPLIAQGISLSDHYNEVLMSAIASQITSFASVYSTVYSGADRSKHQSSASLASVQRIHRWRHRWPVNSPHKGPVTRKMFPFDDVIMLTWNYTSPGCLMVNVLTLLFMFIYLWWFPKWHKFFSDKTWWRHQM